MKKEREESCLDIQNRIQNLLWTVSGDYELDMEVDLQTYEKSRYMAFYDAILQGSFEKHFDARDYEHFLALKVYQGAEPVVLSALGKLCIDSAVWKKTGIERRGVENIRKRAFQDTLKKDARRLSHTDWGYLEECYLRKVLGESCRDERVLPLLEKLERIEDTESLEDIYRCLEELYQIAYEKGFARFFKGLKQELKQNQEEMKEYTDKEYAEEEAESREERPVNIFSGHVDAQDNGKREKPRSRMIYLDQDSTDRMAEYIEKNYGKSILTAQEERYYEKHICKGVHEECRLHVTEGVLHCRMEHNAKIEYVERIREENTRVYRKNLLVTRQNIQALAGMLKRALLTRTEKEICSSEYGKIDVRKLWNLGRTENRKLFQREIRQDNTDFAVEVLIDSSGSQQGRQSLVALQGYIISEALSLAGIPHRVMGYCTFGAYTILNKFRDFSDKREMNERIFEFYGSANNRDGLAVRAAGDSLDQREEENKILIVLSDGKPNDVVAGSQNPGYRRKEEKQEKKKEPYCLDFAVKDTAGEIRKLRNRKIAVLGVFAGEEEDLQAEKKIFGKDFAYIRDITDFANVVGRYLKKQILE